MSVCVPGDHLVPGPLPASLHPPGKCSPGQLLQSRHLRPAVHRAVARPPVCQQVLPRPHHGLLCSLSQPSHGVHQDPGLLCGHRVPLHPPGVHHTGEVDQQTQRTIFNYFVNQKNSFAFGVLCWFIVLGISASFYFSGLSKCSPGCAVTSLLYFQNRTSFQLGIAIPYLSLLLIAIYFSLHIIWVALINCKTKCSVAPTQPQPQAQAGGIFELLGNKISLYFLSIRRGPALRTPTRAGSF